MQRVSKIYKCDCQGEGIEVETDDEFVSIAMWSAGAGPFARSFWQRVKWAWEILRGKPYYTDMCLMRHETANEFAIAVVDAASKAKKAEEDRLIKHNTK